ncbi:hypothetical protein RUM43_013994 [Polyplax serrata]|uniref:Uncharacterized protein n=1 Tax=Polyplax serrata TaxID=468196 RepID=A0AAN8PBG5_POLSC
MPETTSCDDNRSEYNVNEILILPQPRSEQVLQPSNSQNSGIQFTSPLLKALRSKRSPLPDPTHRRKIKYSYKYSEPVYAPQPVYQKPVYVQPVYQSSGCNTCGGGGYGHHGGIGGGGFGGFGGSHSSSQASSNSFSAGFGSPFGGAGFSGSSAQSSAQSSSYGK